MNSNKMKLPAFILFFTIIFIFWITGLKGFAFLAAPYCQTAMPAYKGEYPEGALEAEGREVICQISGFGGEELPFSIYWLGIHAGDAVFEAINYSGNLRITLQVHSSPFVSIFYRVENYAESLIVDGKAVNFRIKQYEGGRKADKETIFDIEGGRITFVDHLKGIEKEHITEGGGFIWDVISSFYYLRTHSLEVGEVVYIDIFDRNKFYTAEVNILRKEQIEFCGMGELAVVVVNPRLKTEGVFRKRGDILIWLTDDTRRIPVRVEIPVPIGRVIAKLNPTSII
ncbi:DUF3108 domain-containing protein [Thermodesulfovibrionales bacterium]|nr:DUF3108 domain-containing protein [Thermodesulfovibrionales bacterium]